MFSYQIPPIKGEDYKENFIHNFFSRLMDMRISRESEVLRVFLDDEKIKHVNKKDLKSIDSIVFLKDVR